MEYDPVMSSILSRSSQILSWLGSQPERLFTVQEIAAACQLPASTCTRILKELLHLGWVDQRGQRQAYRLGPRAYALTTAQAYRSSLVDRSFPVAQELADHLDQLIVVAVRRHTVRQTLFECAPYTGAVASSFLKENNGLYHSAGGRLLLALAGKAVQNQLIAELGLPTAAVWPGVLTRRELDDELRLLKKQSYYRVDFNNGRSSVVAAFPDDDGGWACIGCHVRSSWYTPQRIQSIRVSAAALTS